MKNTENFRETLSIIVIVISVLVLGIVGYKIIAKGYSEDYRFVYSSLLPLIGTWVGVVLAFYFGKENYEVARKGYEKIIDRLSPEVLDDVAVNQVMISKKTMVSMSLLEIEKQTIKEVIDFLLKVDKSRLPVLDENGNIKYIIHSSLLTRPSIGDGNQVKEANISEQMSVFIKSNEKTISTIVLVKENEKLENVRKIMNSQPNCKDVFVQDKNKQLVGWLTDTLILRYINSKKI